MHCKHKHQSRVVFALGVEDGWKYPLLWWDMIRYGSLLNQRNSQDGKCSKSTVGWNILIKKEHHKRNITDTNIHIHRVCTVRLERVEVITLNYCVMSPSFGTQGSLCAFNSSVNDMYQSLSGSFYLYRCLCAHASVRDTSGGADCMCLACRPGLFTPNLLEDYHLPAEPITDHGDKQSHSHLGTCFLVTDECKIVDLKTQNSVFCLGCKMMLESWKS